MRCLYTSIVATLLLAGTSFAETFIVYPGDSLQESIDAASNGDEIMLEPGTHTGPIDLGNKSLSLIATNGSGDTFIEGGGPIISLHGSADGVTIRGITIRNGNNANGGGGGLTIADASPLIEQCVFDGNLALRGGGCHVESASPTFTGCQFLSNTAIAPSAAAGVQEHVAGGALFSGPGCNVTLDSCQFSDNKAAWQLSWNTAESVLAGGVDFDGKQFSGGAVYAHGSGSLNCLSCTFAGNYTTLGDIGESTAFPIAILGGAEASYGGAICFDAGWNTTDAHASLVDCTFIDNSCRTGNIGYMSVGGFDGLKGGAVFTYSVHLSVSDCTFSDNYLHVDPQQYEVGMCCFDIEQDCIVSTEEVCEIAGGAWCLDNSCIPFGTCHVSIDSGYDCVAFQVGQLACIELGGTYVSGHDECYGGMEQGLPWAWNEENQLCCCGFETYCSMSPTIPASMPIAEGGALCMKGWAGVGSLELSGSTFTSNTTDSDYTQGGSGGAIYLDWLANELMIDDCYFEANSCSGTGGAIYNSRTTLGALRNCMFIENHAGTTGAAILWRGFNCDATMEDCLFDGNSSGHGLTNTLHYGAIHFDDSNTRVIATNCEFWNHDGYLDSVFEASGVGCNISLQDCFACNNRELFAPYDAHQVPYPWIDNGGNIIDDICPVHCPADTDGNGVVDIIDLLAVIDGWGTANSDLNGDGTTDVVDLLVVIDGWGTCS